MLIDITTISGHCKKMQKKKNNFLCILKHNKNDIDFIIGRIMSRNNVKGLTKKINYIDSDHYCDKKLTKSTFYHLFFIICLL